MSVKDNVLFSRIGPDEMTLPLTLTPFPFLAANAELIDGGGLDLAVPILAESIAADLVGMDGQDMRSIGRQHAAGATATQGKARNNSESVSYA